MYTRPLFNIPEQIEVVEIEHSLPLIQFSFHQKKTKQKVKRSEFIFIQAKKKKR